MKLLIEMIKLTNHSSPWSHRLRISPGTSPSRRPGIGDPLEAVVCSITLLTLILLNGAPHNPRLSLHSDLLPISSYEDLEAEEKQRK